MTGRIVKFRYGSDTRKIFLDPSCDTFIKMKRVVRKVFTGCFPEDEELCYKYVDSDGDLVTISNDDEWRLAMKEINLKIYVVPLHCLANMDSCAALQTAMAMPYSEAANVSQQLAMMQSLLMKLIDRLTKSELKEDLHSLDKTGIHEMQLPHHKISSQQLKQELYKLGERLSFIDSSNKSEESTRREPKRYQLEACTGYTKSLSGSTSFVSQMSTQKVSITTRGPSATKFTPLMSDQYLQQNAIVLHDPKATQTHNVTSWLPINEIHNFGDSVHLVSDLIQNSPEQVFPVQPFKKSLLGIDTRQDIFVASMTSTSTKPSKIIPSSVQDNREHQPLREQPSLSSVQGPPSGQSLLRKYSSRSRHEWESQHIAGRTKPTTVQPLSPHTQILKRISNDRSTDSYQRYTGMKRFRSEPPMQRLADCSLPLTFFGPNDALCYRASLCTVQPVYPSPYLQVMPFERIFHPRCNSVPQFTCFGVYCREFPERCTCEVRPRSPLVCPEEMESVDCLSASYSDHPNTRYSRELSPTFLRRPLDPISQNFFSRPMVYRPSSQCDAVSDRHVLFPCERYGTRSPRSVDAISMYCNIRGQRDALTTYQAEYTGDQWQRVQRPPEAVCSQWASPSLAIQSFSVNSQPKTAPVVCRRSSRSRSFANYWPSIVRRNYGKILNQPLYETDMLCIRHEPVVCQAITSVHPSPSLSSWHREIRQVTHVPSIEKSTRWTMAHYLPPTLVEPVEWLDDSRIILKGERSGKDLCTYLISPLENSCTASVKQCADGSFVVNDTLAPNFNQYVGPIPSVSIERPSVMGISLQQCVNDGPAEMVTHGCLQISSVCETPIRRLSARVMPRMLGCAPPTKVVMPPVPTHEVTRARLFGPVFPDDLCGPDVVIEEIVCTYPIQPWIRSVDIIINSPIDGFLISSCFQSPPEIYICRSQFIPKITTIYDDNLPWRYSLPEKTHSSHSSVPAANRSENANISIRPEQPVLVDSSLVRFPPRSSSEKTEPKKASREVLDSSSSPNPSQISDVVIDVDHQESMEQNIPYQQIHKTPSIKVNSASSAPATPDGLIHGKSSEKRVSSRNSAKATPDGLIHGKSSEKRVSSRNSAKPYGVQDDKNKPQNNTRRWSLTRSAVKKVPSKTSRTPPSTLGIDVNEWLKFKEMVSNFRSCECPPRSQEDRGVTCTPTIDFDGQTKLSQIVLNFRTCDCPRLSHSQEASRKHARCICDSKFDNGAKTEKNGNVCSCTPEDLELHPEEIPSTCFCHVRAKTPTKKISPPERAKTPTKKISPPEKRKTVCTCEFRRIRHVLALTRNRLKSPTVDRQFPVHSGNLQARYPVESRRTFEFCGCRLSDRERHPEKFPAECTCHDYPTSREVWQRCICGMTGDPKATQRSCQCTPVDRQLHPEEIPSNCTCHQDTQSPGADGAGASSTPSEIQTVDSLPSNSSYTVVETTSSKKTAVTLKQNRLTLLDEQHPLCICGENPEDYEFCGCTMVDRNLYPEIPATCRCDEMAKLRPSEESGEEFCSCGCGTSHGPRRKKRRPHKPHIQLRKPDAWSVHSPEMKDPSVFSDSTEPSYCDCPRIGELSPPCRQGSYARPQVEYDGSSPNILFSPHPTNAYTEEEVESVTTVQTNTYEVDLFSVATGPTYAGDTPIEVMDVTANIRTTQEEASDHRIPGPEESSVIRMTQRESRPSEIHPTLPKTPTGKDGSLSPYASQEWPVASTPLTVHSNHIVNEPIQQSTSSYLPVSTSQVHYEESRSGEPATRSRSRCSRSNQPTYIHVRTRSTTRRCHSKNKDFGCGSRHAETSTPNSSSPGKAGKERQPKIQPQISLQCREAPKDCYFTGEQQKRPESFVEVSTVPRGTYKIRVSTKNVDSASGTTHGLSQTVSKEHLTHVTEVSANLTTSTPQTAAETSLGSVKKSSG